MGVLRSVPQKTGTCSLQDLSKYFCVTASVCGWPLFMEDFTFSFHYSQRVQVMGIIDGQGGPQIAQICHNELQSIIINCELMKLQQYQAAIQNLCFTLDQTIKDKHHQINQIRLKHNLPQLPASEQFPASASLIICIIDEESVTIGNLGECKSYISYTNSPNIFVLISGNHVVERDVDIESISKKGGFVVDNLVNGKFLQSRTIGNLNYKNLNDNSKSIIISEPSVFTLRLQDLNVIVMGSSGLWQRPVTVLNQIFEEKNSPLQQKQKIRNIIENLVAQNPDDEFGKQNISVTALFFSH